RKDDAPAEGGNIRPNAPAKKQKRGRKGKKPVPPNQRGSGQAEDSEEAFAAAQTARDLEAPLEAVVASSTTCLRSRALITRVRSIIPSSSARCSRSTTTASRTATKIRRRTLATKVEMTSFPQWRTPSSSLEEQ